MTRRVPLWIALLTAATTAAALLLGLAVGMWVADRSEGEDMSAGESMPCMDMGAGHEMTPVDVSAAAQAPAFARGNQLLPGRVVEGLTEYTLTPQLMRWNILPAVQVGAYTYNGTVPGPLLRLTPGERVRFVVDNRLPEPTSIHWHGLQVDNAQDGAAGVTQASIQPGARFVYQWTVPNTPGTFFYHSHFEADKQQALGLYGALVIEDRAPRTVPDVDALVLLGEWTVTPQGTLPSMDMDGAKPNFFTINGKSYPETETLKVRVGQRVRLRVIGSGQFVHPMHLHGQPFEIVATDGNSVPEGTRLVKDTVLVSPGERYDIEFIARAPGKWLFHCHINHHTTNDGAEEQGGGGLTMVVEVTS